MRRIVTMLVFCCCAAGIQAVPVDSIGYVSENGRIYVLHRVEERETLYSISRRYAIQIPEILENNPSAKNGLIQGDTLHIPYKKGAVTRNGVKVHTVEQGQTLYFISRLYDVEVDEIKKWNNLASSELNIGQELRIYPSTAPPKAYELPATPPQYRPENGNKKFHIVAEEETLYAISRQYGITVDQIRAWNELAGTDIHIGQQLIVGEQGGREERAEDVAVVDVSPGPAPEPEPKKPEEEIVYLNADHSRKYDPIHFDDAGFRTQVESGLAEVIEGTADTRKYLALHRDLPVGTILMVRNEMNNKVVFVRILGRLPDTGDNQNLAIKISQAAYDRLGGVGKRFRVELTYIPLQDQNG